MNVAGMNIITGMTVTGVTKPDERRDAASRSSLPG